MGTEEARPEAVSASGAPSAAPLPAAVSWALLLLLVAGVAWAATSLAPRRADVAATRASPARATLLRDVLTGRLLGPDGVPLPPETGPGSRGAPLRLRFVPSSDVAQSTPTVDRLVAFLGARTGYAVEGATLPSYGLVVEEIAGGRCDVAFLTAASYARAWYATERNDDPADDIEAILAVVRRGSESDPGSDLAYRAALVVRKESPLQGLEDVADQTTVAMGHRTSGASSILPSALFARMGVRPRIQRYGSYPIIVNALLQGAADVACVWWSPPNAETPQNDARQLVVGTNPDVFERTRIIGFTGWIPNEPVVVRKALPEAVKHDLARALTLYVTLRTQTEEGRRELVAVGSITGFLPATNDDFRPLREVIEDAFADDPEGRQDFMAGSR
jgi:phosphonate transport system substrate-binding protein